VDSVKIRYFATDSFIAPALIFGTGLTLKMIGSVWRPKELNNSH